MRGLYSCCISFKEGVKEEKFSSSSYCMSIQSTVEIHERCLVSAESVSKVELHERFRITSASISKVGLHERFLVPCCISF
jgi:hypothetical protein